MIDVGVIVATLLGPIFAVQAQKIVEHTSAVSKRRENIFRKLMTTRGEVIARDHVEALNMIDLDFRGKKFRAIRTAWRLYLNHLNTPATPDSMWGNKRNELLANLLVAMGHSLGYKELDELDVMKGSYFPAGYSTEQESQTRLRSTLITFLENNKEISSNLVSAIRVELQSLGKKINNSPSQDI